MDNLRIVRVDEIQRVQDLVDHPVGSSPYHGWRLVFVALHELIEVAVINGHEDFDIIANLESLCVYVWHDIVLMQSA